MRFMRVIARTPSPKSAREFGWGGVGTGMGRALPPNESCVDEYLSELGNLLTARLRALDSGGWT